MKKIQLALPCMILNMLLCASLILYACSSSNQSFINSSDKSYYTHNPGKKSGSLPFFPEEIPTEFCVTYHYYCYGYSATDDYLELAFDKEEQLASFVKSILDRIEPSQIVTRTNPFDSSYVEYFYTGRYASTARNGNDIRFNYFDMDSSFTSVSAHYHAMSVSADEKKVIITFSDGQFLCDQFIPMYLQFFGLPAGEQTNTEIIFP